MKKQKYIALCGILTILPNPLRHEKFKLKTMLVFFPCQGVHMEYVPQEQIFNAV